MSQATTTKRDTGNAFTYNILVPDFMILVLGLTGSFGALLTVFS